MEEGFFNLVTKLAAQLPAKDHEKLLFAQEQLIRLSETIQKKETEVKSLSDELEQLKINYNQLIGDHNSENFKKKLEMKMLDYKRAKEKIKHLQETNSSLVMELGKLKQ